ncbi:MAG: tetratricopeptide repeat protein, partial [Candidatus Acidoferrales bacterium]
MALLATIATGLLWAVPLPGSEALAEELSQLAQALRQDPTPQNYRALARFAEESPQGELSAQAAFALGMAEFEAGRWAQARERFRAARASRRLRDFAALQRARAELELGLWEAAGETLQPLLSPGNPLRDTARVLEVRRLVGAGRAREAVEWLAAQPEVHHRPALLRALAEAQRAAGEPVAAAETLHRIYYEFPLSREAGPSNELLAELRAELRSDYPAPSEVLRRLRAERLWARGAYHGARSAYLDLSVRAPEPARTEARLRAAEALYRLGSRRVACRELRSVSQVTPALEAEFRAFRVRCALRGGRYWEVEEELALLAAQFRRSRWYQEALQVAGRTTWAQGEMGRARQYYQQLVEVFPNGEAAAEAHWKLAWLSYRRREAAATRILEEHLQHFPHSPFVPRALY